MHVDLHLHLLPGVDDGPPDEAAALEHAARLAHGIPGAHERAWRSPHEHRVRAAIVAARQRRS